MVFAGSKNTGNDNNNTFTVILNTKSRNSPNFVDLFDDTGSTERIPAHRQAIADAIYYKHKHLFQHPSPVHLRLMAWHDSSATLAIFGASTWHLTAAVLPTLRSWELRKLRQVFRLRRQPLEPFDRYNQPKRHHRTPWMLAV